MVPDQDESASAECRFPSQHHGIGLPLKSHAPTVEVGLMTPQRSPEGPVIVDYLLVRRILCEAIAYRRLVAPQYDGSGWRVLEPVVHGFSAKGTEIVNCYQHSGASDSASPAGMKCFAVSKIVALEVVDVPLLASHRSTRHFPPTGMSTIHCSA